MADVSVPFSVTTTAAGLKNTLNWSPLAAMQSVTIERDGETLAVLGPAIVYVDRLTEVGEHDYDVIVSTAVRSALGLIDSSGDSGVVLIESTNLDTLTVVEVSPNVFNLTAFPEPGTAGPEGPEGPTGETGPTGPAGPLESLDAIAAAEPTAGAVDMNGFPIQNLQPGIAGTDAATVSQLGSGGGGAVDSVGATNASIVVGGTADNPTLKTGTLDVVATQGPPAAAVAMNAKKITGLANGTGSTDAAAFGQIPASLPPNGTASGDLSGSYPAPTVAKVNGHPFASTAPTTGQVPTWSGTQYVPETPSGGGGGGGLTPTFSPLGSDTPITASTLTVLGTVMVPAGKVGLLNAHATFSAGSGDIDLMILPHSDSSPADALASITCAMTTDEDGASGALASIVPVAGSDQSFDLACYTEVGGFTALAESLVASGGVATSICCITG